MELQMYQTTFPNFKYEPLNFVSMKIGTNSRTTTTTPFVQPIVTIKPTSGCPCPSDTVKSPGTKSS